MSLLTPLDAANEPEYQISDLKDRYQRQALAMAASLVSLVDLRDHYTAGHSQRVANYVRGIALEMSLPDDETEILVFAASLHDIGKIGVPDPILLKRGKLTDTEMQWILKYPEWGWMALSQVEFFREVALLILHHHERLDGKGYPSRLRGTEIPLGSRIIALADSYDALRTERPYRAARTRDEALAELSRCRETHFDSQVFNAFGSWLEHTANSRPYHGA